MYIDEQLNIQVRSTVHIVVEQMDVIMKNMFAWWKVCSRTCSGSVTRLLNLSDTLIVSKLPGIPWWVISMSHACFRKDLRASYQQWFCSELSLTTVWPRLTTVNREIPLKWIEWYLLRFRITWESSTKIWLKRFNWSKISTRNRTSKSNITNYKKYSNLKCPNSIWFQLKMFPTLWLNIHKKSKFQLKGMVEMAILKCWETKNKNVVKIF